MRMPKGSLEIFFGLGVYGKSVKQQKRSVERRIVIPKAESGAENATPAPSVENAATACGFGDGLVLMDMASLLEIYTGGKGRWC